MLQIIASVHFVERLIFVWTYRSARDVFLGDRKRLSEKAQFNIRVDGEVLEAYRDFCLRNGLDPQAQIIHFMRRVVQTDLDLQDKLWEALRARSR